MTNILEVRDLVKTYPAADGGRVRALDGVSLDLERGEILGIVGESGCGKSTLARSVMRLEEPDSGSVRLGDTDLTTARGRALMRARARIQIVFQDPFGSLNPRHRVRTIVGEPLVVHGRKGVDARVRELLEIVGLPTSAGDRLPHEFSGGQRQRIAIARALALSPEVIVADESVSALDVSIQSQIINLLARLRKELDLSIVFISHDLSVVRHLCDRTEVMYMGRVVEASKTRALFKDPRHPYSRALLSAIPVPPKKAVRTERGERIILSGELPDPAHRPSGCAFHPRCFMAEELCRHEEPALLRRRLEKDIGQADEGRLAACHFAGDPVPGGT
ncbi:ABC transporter ATP-binding protein [Pararhizobium mangrovi]|uniref:ATP-binding cassette domain-containing protein n=1 Tax=Pararhizobium mangrovi TaxID=2590452 RepID=A0A506TYC2_9HYPH|nr:oligopeptide/dipeptide ABC transporter ATP-binding protein [Pararhizobium mangrovi]TPW26316.1 ATP-binding cassette domain-containing protein [Pararhizobium mangrovi]